MIKFDIRVWQENEKVKIEVGSRTQENRTISELGTVLDIVNRLYEQQHEFDSVELTVEK